MVSATVDRHGLFTVLRLPRQKHGGENKETSSLDHCFGQKGWRSEERKVLRQIEVDIVLIKKEILEAIIQHAREDVPLECCGLLMGQGKLISHLSRMKNALQSPISYSMEPRALLRFFKELRSLQLIHLGIYHSHPTSEAYPSSVDVEQAYYPDCTYFIASLRNPRFPSVRAFSILDRTVQEKEIQVID